MSTRPILSRVTLSDGQQHTVDEAEHFICLTCSTPRQAFYHPPAIDDEDVTQPLTDAEIYALLGYDFVAP